MVYQTKHRIPTSLVAKRSRIASPIFSDFILYRIAARPDWDLPGPSGAGTLVPALLCGARCTRAIRSPGQSGSFSNRPQ